MLYITHRKYFRHAGNDEIGRVAATSVHRQYLLEAGKALENLNTNASLERIIPYAPALFETKETPNIGPDNAAVAVVEFFDYQCHFCMKVAPVVESVLSQSSDVKFFFKEFPIFARSKPVSAMGAATGLHVYQTFGAEAYRKYHNNLMTSAYVFFNNQREFTLSDLDMVVNKSGFKQLIRRPSERPLQNVHLRKHAVG